MICHIVDDNYVAFFDEINKNIVEIKIKYGKMK